MSSALHYVEDGDRYRLTCLACGASGWYERVARAEDSYKVTHICGQSPPFSRTHVGTIGSVLYLSCPKCKAPNGQACRRPDGLHALAPHVARRRAVDALQNKR